MGDPHHAQDLSALALLRALAYAKAMTPITLFSMPSSGNSYKVRLLLALTGQPYTHVACEAGSTALDKARREGHLPFGTVPVLHLPGGEVLSESGAILSYLAEGTPFWPEDRIARARMLAWMFFEQNRLEPVIAVRASLRCYPHRAHEATPERMDTLLHQGHALLAWMDDAVTAAPYFGGSAPNLADIALYGYTHSAGERGGYDMARFPALEAWCERIAALPGHVPLEALP